MYQEFLRRSKFTKPEELRNEQLSAAIAAATQGDTATLESLHQQGFNLGGPISFLGRRLTHLAASAGQAEAIRFLHEKGVDLEAFYKFGGTPAHEAAEMGHVDVLRTIHALGKSVTKMTPQGITPLHQAIVRGQLGAIETLHGLGADVNQKDRDGTPLTFFAAEYGAAGVLDTLYRLGADRDALNARGHHLAQHLAATALRGGGIHFTQVPSDPSTASRQRTPPTGPSMS